MVYNAPQTDLEMKKCSQRQQGRTTAQLNPERTFTKCSQHEQNPELQCWVLHCHQEPCMRLAPEDYGDEGSSRVTEALSRHLVHMFLSSCWNARWNSVWPGPRLPAAPKTGSSLQTAQVQ
jgi:hypothetical protein